jgi:hypothetical protein
MFGARNISFKNAHVPDPAIGNTLILFFSRLEVHVCWSFRVVYVSTVFVDFQSAVCLGAVGYRIFVMLVYISI